MANSHVLAGESPPIAAWVQDAHSEVSEGVGFSTAGAFGLRLNRGSAGELELAAGN